MSSQWLAWLFKHWYETRMIYEIHTINVVTLLINVLLDGGNSKICYFHPENWGNDPNWRAYFSNGLVQSPTRLIVSTYVSDFMSVPKIQVTKSTETPAGFFTSIGKGVTWRFGAEVKNSLANKRRNEDFSKQNRFLDVNWSWFFILQLEGDVVQTYIEDYIGIVLYCMIWYTMIRTYMNGIIL